MERDPKSNLIFMAALFLTFLFIMQVMTPSTPEQPPVPAPAPAKPASTSPAATTAPGVEAPAPVGAEAEAASEFSIAVVRATNPEAEDPPRGDPDERGYEATFSTRGGGLSRYRLLGYFRKAGRQDAGDETILLAQMFSDSAALAVEKISVNPPGDSTRRRTQPVRDRVYRLVRVPDGAVVRQAGAVVTTLPEGVERGGDKLVMALAVPELGCEILREFTFADLPADGDAPDGPDGRRFAFNTSVRIVNRNADPAAYQYTLIGPAGALPDERSRQTPPQFLVGRVTSAPGAEVAVSTAATHISSLKPDEVRPDQSARIAWVGVRNRFFASMLAVSDGPNLLSGDAELRVPVANLSYPDLPADTRALLAWTYNNYAASAAPAPEVALNVWADAVTVPAGHALEHRYQFYGGPAETRRLESADKRFTGIVVYTWSWLDPLARVLVLMLRGLHTVIGNYGVAMILLTIIIKSLMHPLTKKMYLSSQKMQVIQPLVKQLRAKYEKEPQKLQQETMKLYREHQINPAGGCLPLLVQMPIFFALYGAFSQSFSLRQASFIPVWIPDLSVPDTVYTLGGDIPLLGSPEISLLPILYLALQFLQMSLQPKSPDPQVQQQQRMMKFMPLIFVFIFYAMPSGLVLYFTASSLYSVIESLYIRHKYPPITPGAAAAVGVENGVPVDAARLKDHAGIGMGAQHAGKKKHKRK